MMELPTLTASALLLALLLVPLAIMLAELAPPAWLAATRDPRNNARPTRDQDFAVLVPIYGNIDYLQNVSFLAPYGSKVILCTTGGEKLHFYDELERVAAKHGFRTFISAYAPAAQDKRQVGGITRDKVIQEALRSVDAEYTICIDADTQTHQPLDEMVGLARSQGLDVVSVPLSVSNRATLLGRLQAHEYRMSMRLRRLMPWLCSGACHLGRTSALRSIMHSHSLFFQGNDAEVGILASMKGYRVGRLTTSVPTTVPETPGAWWRQRYAWAGGEFRLFVVNSKLLLRHPWFILYGAVVMFALAPLRMYSVVEPSLLLAVVLAVYWGVIVAINWRQRDRALLLYPLYGLLNSLVMIPLGVVSYADMALKSRNAGIIRAQVDGGGAPTPNYSLVPGGAPA